MAAPGRLHSEMSFDVFFRVIDHALNRQAAPTQTYSLDQRSEGEMFSQHVATASMDRRPLLDMAPESCRLFDKRTATIGQSLVIRLPSPVATILRHCYGPTRGQADA